MGIESDQLVFDYLSRVGDLAQQRQLPSGTRMRLVTELRGEIERRRARAVGDAPATIRRILARLGTPDEVVSAAGSRAARDAWDAGEASSSDPGRFPGRSPGAGAGAGAGEESSRTRPTASRPGPSVPVQRTGEGREAADRPKGLRRMVPRPRPADPGDADAGDADGFPDDVPSPPHLASTEELGPRGSEPDWWRVDGGPLGGTDMVTGFTGGVEIPEILRPPRPTDGQDPSAPRTPLPKGLRKTDPPSGTARPAGPGDAAGTEAADDAEDLADATAGRPRRGLLRRLRRPAGEGTRAVRGRVGSWSNPLLLIAAGLLLVGAVLGNLFALGFGWVIAYASRRLTTNESKLAVLGLPGLAVAAGVVWLWGRAARHWGDPVVQGHMSDAIGDTWPWVLRGAAVSSALFLVWRSQRRL